MKEFPEKPGFIDVPHPADIAVAITADSLNSLFREALKAMREIAGVKYLLNKSMRDQFTITGKTNELLLVGFLTEMIYYLEKGYWPDELEIHIDGSVLTCSSIQKKCVLLGHEIKAVTFSEMEIIKLGEFWHTKIVFDV